MAVYSMTATQVSIAGGDQTAFVKSAELALDAEQLDTTNMASGGWKESIGGLKGGTVSITFNDDFADNSVDEDLHGILGTVVAVAIKPTASAISASNPEYQFNALVTQWSMGGGVGELAGKTLTWPITGAVVRDVVA